MHFPAFVPRTTAIVLGLCALFNTGLSLPQSNDVRNLDLDQSSRNANVVPRSAIERRAVDMKRWGNSNAYTGHEPASAFVTGNNAPLKAKEGYEALEKLVKDKFKKEGGKFKYTLLVAALYVPQKGFFLATNAGKDGFGFTPSEAPAWWYRVKDRRNLSADGSKYHAEDLAMYFFEKSSTPKLAAGATYPRGSKIAVYGHFRGDEKPGPKSICGQGVNQSIDPSCFQVIRALEIDPVAG